MWITFSQLSRFVNGDYSEIKGHGLINDNFKKVILNGCTMHRGGGTLSSIDMMWK